MLKIREVLNDADLRICAEIIRRSFLTVADDFGLTPDNCPANPAFISFERLKSLRNERTTQYMLLSGESPAGFVAIERSKDNKEVFYIEKLAVLPGFRHQDLGKKLMSFAEEQIILTGGKKISLGVIDENLVLKKWYRKMGYIETTSKTFAHLPFRVRFMIKQI